FGGSGTALHATAAADAAGTGVVNAGALGTGADDSCLGGRFDAAVEQATDIDIAEHVDRRAAAIEEPVHGDRPHASVGQAWLKA
ncbi:MAG TPA: hypothetical protein PLY87_12175, partial [Planctomycetaceae bacterium]|nr:hypothetical protein [Planctomycetaceae bacterium]